MTETEGKTAEHAASAPRAQVGVDATGSVGGRSIFISRSLPAQIRGLYESDMSERSTKAVLDLAADLVQELIDMRAADAGVTSGEVVDECDRDHMGICRNCGMGLSARKVLEGDFGCPSPVVAADAVEVGKDHARE